MARLFITSALALLALAGTSAIAKTSDAPATTEGNDGAVTEQIRAKLTQDGYKDITILPTTYAVSATDKTGKPVLLLIGPQSSTVLQGEDKDPSTAQSPDGDKKEMQQ